MCFVVILKTTELHTSQLYCVRLHLNKTVQRGLPGDPVDKNPPTVQGDGFDPGLEKITDVWDS